MCASTAVNASLSGICSTIVETLAKAVPDAGSTQGVGKKVDAMGKEKKCFNAPWVNCDQVFQFFFLA